jgi:hypothetical protein
VHFSHPLVAVGQKSRPGIDFYLPTHANSCVHAARKRCQTCTQQTGICTRNTRNIWLKLNEIALQG